MSWPSNDFELEIQNRLDLLEKTLTEVMSVANRSREDGDPAPIDALKHIIVMCRAATLPEGEAG